MVSESDASIVVTVVAAVSIFDSVYASVVVMYRMGVWSSIVPGVPFGAWTIVDVNGAVSLDELV